MVRNNRCPYVYGRGSKKGEACNKKCEGEFCFKHTEKNKEKCEEEDIQTIISTVDFENENEEKNSSVKSHKSNQKINEYNYDILITKHFVYDCIRDFLKDYNDVNEVLGNKSSSKSSGSNLTTIMAMAGIGCLPILLKNLSGSNIIDALSKQTVDNSTCDFPRVHQQYDKVRGDAKQERTNEEGNQNSQNYTNGREIQSTTEECDKRYRII